MHFKYISIFLSILLIGCNGNSDSSGKRDPEPTLPNTNLKVKVNYVKSDSPSTLEFDANIKSVEVVSRSNEQCHYVQYKEQELETIQDKGSLCLYEVLLSSGSNLSKNLIASATTSSNDFHLLRTISTNAIIGNSVKIDFNTELADSEHPNESYMLSDTAYVISNDDITTIDTDPVDDSLTITADELGIKRVLYSYENGSGDVIQGFIYIVTTNEENLGLESKDLFVSVNTSDITTINVDDVLTTDKEYVTFFDVIAYDQTNITISEDSRSFSFASKYAGTYDVNYTIDDGQGGLTSGIIRFVVSGSEGGIRNIFVDSLSSTFHYVENIAEANANSHFAYEGTYVENGLTGIAEQEYPTYDYESASATCLLQGLTLPTVDEFEQLWHQEKSLFNGDNDRNWPVGVPYITWSGTEDKGKLIDMSSNSSFPSAISGDDLYGYLSCVGSAYDGITILENVITEPTQIHVQATYESIPVSAYTRITEWSVDDPSQASISESGFMTPLVNDGQVHLTATDENGNTDTKLIRIRNNLLYMNTDGTKTGQDPYFNESAIDYGLIPSPDIDETSCTEGSSEFNDATGFNTNQMPFSGLTGRLCTNSYYTPFSGSGMFSSIVYYVPYTGTDEGMGLYLEGSYNISDFNYNDEAIFSGAVNINDLMNYASDDMSFELIIENKTGSGSVASLSESDTFYLMLTYQTESNRWIPSVYLDSSYPTKSTLLSSSLNVDESTGWLYFEVSSKLSPDAFTSDSATIKYNAHISKLESDVILNYALDELSVVFIDKG